MRPASRAKATADSDIVESRFIDLVPDVRVVQAVDFVSDDPAYAGTMTMRWELAGVDEEHASTSLPAMSRTESTPTITPPGWPNR
jgi:hypothetical protein